MSKEVGAGGRLDIFLDSVGILFSVMFGREKGAFKSHFVINFLCSRLKTRVAIEKQVQYACFFQ